jgi:hypothetical protein
MEKIITPDGTTCYYIKHNIIYQFIYYGLGFSPNLFFDSKQEADEYLKKDIAIQIAVQEQKLADISAQIKHLKYLLNS